MSNDRGFNRRLTRAISVAVTAFLHKLFAPRMAVLALHSELSRREGNDDRAQRGNWRCALPAFGLVLSLSGCAAFRSYDTELYRTLDEASAGNMDNAIGILESNNRGANKDLLYYLELGMLQRLGDRYAESQKSWMSANERVHAWERTAQTDPEKLLPGAASYLINDRLRPYEGHDYEKVMLLTYIALNHLTMGEYGNARVAITQMHELEAVIAELRSKETTKVEQDAEKRGARTSFKELNGYPVQTIDNPEVNALKHSYQSALSHYLAGFVYEALGEPSLAAPGYRLANELQPNRPLLEEALRGLDQRTLRRADRRAVRDRIGHGPRSAVAPVPSACPGEGQADPDSDLVPGHGGDINALPARPGQAERRPVATRDADNQHRPDGTPGAPGRHARHHAARHDPLHGQGGDAVSAATAGAASG